MTKLLLGALALSLALFTFAPPAQAVHDCGASTDFWSVTAHCTVGNVGVPIVVIVLCPDPTFCDAGVTCTVETAPLFAYCPIVP